MNSSENDNIVNISQPTQPQSITDYISERIKKYVKGNILWLHLWIGSTFVPLCCDRLFFFKTVYCFYCFIA